MKAKKALKRLTRVEGLLSDVIEQYAGSDGNMRELLDTAKLSVVRAKKTMNGAASPGAAEKKPVKAENSKSHLTADGRKRLSLAAKKRWAAAKRKGISAVTGRPLSQTA